MGFIGLPGELHCIIGSFLPSYKDSYNLSLVSKGLHATLKDQVKNRIIQEVIIPYGAIGSKEDITQSIVQTKKILKIAKDLEIEQVLNNKERYAFLFVHVMNKTLQKKSYLLYFDEKGMPYIANHQQMTSNSAHSFWKRLKVRYQFCRGEYHKSIHNQVKGIFDSYNEIIKEFQDQALNQDYPLQDLRDRSYRVQVMTEEREMLGYALWSSAHSHQAFLASLPAWERMAFSIVSWFHSFFQPTFDTKFAPLSFPQLDNYKPLHLIWKSEKTISVDNENKEVEIQVDLIGKLKDQLCLTIQTREGKYIEPLKSLYIKRSWDQEDKAEIYPLPDGSFLKVTNIDEVMNLQNQSSIKDITDQLIDEIIRRESGERLELSSDYKPILEGQGPILPRSS